MLLELYCVLWRTYNKSVRCISVHNNAPAGKIPAPISLDIILLVMDTFGCCEIVKIWDVALDFRFPWQLPGNFYLLVAFTILVYRFFFLIAMHKMHVNIYGKLSWYVSNTFTLLKGAVIWKKFSIRACVTSTKFEICKVIDDRHFLHECVEIVEIDMFVIQQSMWSVN